MVVLSLAPASWFRRPLWGRFEALALLFLVEAQRTRSGLRSVSHSPSGPPTFFFKAQIFVVLVPFLVVYIRLSATRPVPLLAHPAPDRRDRRELAGHPGQQQIPSRAAHRAGPDGFRGVRPLCRRGLPAARIVAETVEKGFAGVGPSRFYLAVSSLVVLATLGALTLAVPVLCLLVMVETQAPSHRRGAVDRYPSLHCGPGGPERPRGGGKSLGAGSSSLCLDLLGRAGLVRGKTVGPGCSDTPWARWRWTPLAFCAVGIVLLIVPWRMGLHIQEGKVAWRAACSNLRFPRRLIECGRYIARHGSRGDLVQDTQYDPHLVFSSLAERRSYLARPDLWKRHTNPTIAQEVRHHRALLEELKTMTTLEGIEKFVARRGIRWYLMHPDDHLAWPSRASCQANLSVRRLRGVRSLVAAPRRASRLPARILTGAEFRQIAVLLHLHHTHFSFHVCGNEPAAVGGDGSTVRSTLSTPCRRYEGASPIQFPTISLAAAGAAKPL